MAAAYRFRRRFQTSPDRAVTTSASAVMCSGVIMGFLSERHDLTG